MIFVQRGVPALAITSADSQATPRIAPTPGDTQDRVNATHLQQLATSLASLLRQ